MRARTRAAAAAVPLGTRYRSGNGLGQRRTVKQPAFLKFPVAGADGEGTLLLQSPPTCRKPSRSTQLFSLPAVVVFVIVVAVDGAPPCPDRQNACCLPQIWSTTTSDLLGLAHLAPWLAVLFHCCTNVNPNAAERQIYIAA